MSNLASELRATDATLADQLRAQEQAKYDAQIRTQLDGLAELIRTATTQKNSNGVSYRAVRFTPGKFSRELFHLSDGLPDVVARLKQWAKDQGFPAPGSLHDHSCNWREDCSEAGCKFDVGVCFFF